MPERELRSPLVGCPEAWQDGLVQTASSLLPKEGLGERSGELGTERGLEAIALLDLGDWAGNDPLPPPVLGVSAGWERWTADVGRSRKKQTSKGVTGREAEGYLSRHLLLLNAGSCVGSLVGKKEKPVAVS